MGRQESTPTLQTDRSSGTRQGLWEQSKGLALKRQRSRLPAAVCAWAGTGASPLRWLKPGRVWWRTWHLGRNLPHLRCPESTSMALSPWPEAQCQLGKAESSQVHSARPRRGAETAGGPPVPLKMTPSDSERGPGTPTHGTWSYRFLSSARQDLQRRRRGEGSCPGWLSGSCGRL